jgi:hypothetical protein
MSTDNRTAVATQENKGAALAGARQIKTVSVRIGERFGVAPAMVIETVRQLVFRPKPTDVITDADICAYLIVVDEYGFNPFLRECYAFKDKWGNIQPVVGVDGWIRLGNEAMGNVDVCDADGCPIIRDGEAVRKRVRLLEGVEFEWEWEGGKVGKVPVSCTAIVHRRDRTRPTVVTEYFDECVQPTEPWKKWPKRMLRHKALIQGYRVAFGFTRIIDEDEMERVLSLQGETFDAQISLPQHASADDVRRQLTGSVEVNPEAVAAKTEPARAAMDRQGAGSPGEMPDRRPFQRQPEPDPEPAEDWEEAASREMDEAGPEESDTDTEQIDRFDFIADAFEKLKIGASQRQSILKRFGSETIEGLETLPAVELCNYLQTRLREAEEENAAEKPTPKKTTKRR